MFWYFALGGLAAFSCLFVVVGMPLIECQCSLPDMDEHFVYGKIENVDGVWYKFVKITFTDGREIWFDGRGIFDECIGLRTDCNYSFGWRWDCFERDLHPNEFFHGKNCFSIERVNNR